VQEKIDRETRTNLDKAGLLITYQENDEKKPKANCDKTGRVRINVKFTRVCVATAAMEKQQILHILCVCVCVCVCVCGLSYPSCAVLYFHLWPVCLYNTFPPYLTNGTIFEGGGELMNINYVF